MTNYSMSVMPNIPALSNYEAYKNYVYSLQPLTENEERYLLTNLKTNNDLKSAQLLILSQLKTVIKIAKEYKGYGIPEEDLVQEGNIGLMKAVKNYDLSHKVRLYSYALLWIKSEIQNYILKNWRLVKIGTTNNYKKLFFNYKSLQKKLIENFTEKRLINKNIANKLDISENEVNEIEQYFTGNDLMVEDVEDQLVYNKTPEDVVEEKNDSLIIKNIIEESLGALNDKQRKVIEMRYLSEVKSTHKEIAELLNVSSERVRQIEGEALLKIKNQIGDKSSYI